MALEKVAKIITPEHNYHDVYFEQGKFHAPTVANCLFKDVNA